MDVSDIGFLSSRPYELISQGFSEDEFENRFSYGFKIIVLGTIVSWIYAAAYRVITYIIGKSGPEMESGSFIQIMEITSIITIIGNILILLFILYGLIIIVSSLKHYIPKKAI